VKPMMSECNGYRNYGIVNIFVKDADFTVPIGGGSARIRRGKFFTNVSVFLALICALLSFTLSEQTIAEPCSSTYGNKIRVR